MMLWDEWIDQREIYPSLNLPNLLENVRRICGETGVYTEEFLGSHWAFTTAKHAPPSLGVSVPLTGWIDDPMTDVYYQFCGSFPSLNEISTGKLMKETKFYLRLWQGEYCERHEAIVETDQACDVKLDDKSIVLASVAVKIGDIILPNSPRWKEENVEKWMMNESESDVIPPNSPRWKEEDVDERVVNESDSDT